MYTGCSHKIFNIWKHPTSYWPVGLINYYGMLLWSLALFPKNQIYYKSTKHANQSLTSWSQQGQSSWPGWLVWYSLMGSLFNTVRACHLDISPYLISNINYNPTKSANQSLTSWSQQGQSGWPGWLDWCSIYGSFFNCYCLPFANLALIQIPIVYY